MIIKIDNLSHDLRGIAKINGKVTFIQNALPNEVVDIKLLEEKKNYNTAYVNSYIDKSDDRRDSICPYFNNCGGCSFSGVAYDKALKYKKSIFVDIFKRYANIDIDPNIIGSDKEYGYRNKISMKVYNGNLSLVKEDTDILIEVDKCYLVNDNINGIIKLLSNIDLNGLDEVIIRGTNSIMVILKGVYDYNKVIHLLKDSVNSIIYNDRCVYGKDYIIIDVDKYKYAVYADSFFQVNTNMISRLYDKIKEYAGKEKSLLDLYCGAGTIGIYLSDNFEIVRGIEINKDSIKGANFNKELNGINNISFVLANANTANIVENVVVVDPPRSGLDNKTRDILLNAKIKRLVYVSCNPITLARDIDILKDKYELKDITIFDNFSNTKHIESVCLLKKIN